MWKDFIMLGDNHWIISKAAVDFFLEVFIWVGWDLLLKAERTLNKFLWGQVIKIKVKQAEYKEMKQNWKIHACLQ